MTNTFNKQGSCLYCVSSEGVAAFCPQAWPNQAPEPTAPSWRFVAGGRPWVGAAAQRGRSASRSPLLSRMVFVQSTPKGETLCHVNGLLQ